MAFRFVQCMGVCQVRNMWTKYFYYFQGLESAEVSPNSFKSHELSVEMIPAEDFFKFNPLPPGISGVFEPPSHKNFHNPISRGGGGVDFFWNNPFD